VVPTSNPQVIEAFIWIAILTCIRQFEFDPSRQSDFDPPLSS
jgi:hypothetical protein